MPSDVPVERLNGIVANIDQIRAHLIGSEIQNPRPDSRSDSSQEAMQMRAPFQVLVFPFLRKGSVIQFAVFRRADHRDDCWQGLAGGGEGSESPLDAARREAFEEAGIALHSGFRQLDSMCMIPVVNISGFTWGPNVLVIPEWTFGVELSSESLTISHEHLEVRWASFEEATRLLRWDSNRAALWELNHRLISESLPSVFHISGSDATS